MPQLEFMAIEGVPEVAAGDALGELFWKALQQSGLELEADDIVVVAQKIISKAEGRMRDLGQVTPSERALELSRELEGKDARLVELILQETHRIVRTGRETIIVETHHGLVCANAGIDLSNTGIDRALRMPPPGDFVRN